MGKDTIFILPAILPVPLNGLRIILDRQLMVPYLSDDDGSLYLFRAGNPSIYAHKLDRDGTVHEAHELFGTSMGHWTEGPGVFKRAGRYYITMTGNHLLSRGYRIDYAVSEKGPLGPWMVPRNKTVLVNSDYESGSLAIPPV